LIFILNGPPGSGKDSACSILKILGYKHLSFKYHLFRETAKYFNISIDWFMDGYDDRRIKERSEDWLNGFSRREALIYVSEEIIKPTHGSDYFGKKAAEEMQPNVLYCFSDGGFKEELQPIINKLGTENIILIQLTREGCSFSSDSRRYISGTNIQEYVLGKETPIQKTYILDGNMPIKTYRVHNNSTEEEFHSVLIQIHEKESNARKITQEKGDGY
jgi:hypothetical protein